MQEIDENVENIENTESIDNADNVEVVEDNAGADVAVTDESVESVSKAGRNLRKERTGIVVSNKMDKTAVVKIEERVTHDKYSKIMKRSIKFKVHDENNECNVGDKVLIMETRPLSKDKHFRLVKILEKAK
jgi:small subunit ribosomal protein S17